MPNASAHGASNPRPSDFTTHNSPTIEPAEIAVSVGVEVDDSSTNWLGSSVAERPACMG